MSAVEPAHEILSAANAVWVNDATGHCIGRFGRLGIDVHHPVAVQLEHGGQCQACTHGRTTEAEWQRFRQLMWEHHQVRVPDSARPGFLAGGTSTAVITPTLSDQAAGVEQLRTLLSRPGHR
jgi:hypothetical protein